ncbi:hypothetical protein [Streptomyces sp. SID161]|uniref:hypothetical protein n=1 Tax=Streptomyces sp. SID161 TaxID=2690251 RepID=UPI0013705D96|nr:hypothetical protein [Streptomyces sp. SID161]MYW49604.1 hypothetical protein [Streptomyces sp. SID161]
MTFDPYELQARRLRIMAALHRKKAAELEVAAEAALATRSMRRFADAWNAGVARDMAEHPDLAELNVQLDGFYGAIKPEAGQTQQGDGTTQGCKCRSCWGWFVEEHPSEDLDELGKDLSWWAGLPEHRDASAADRDTEK